MNALGVAWMLILKDNQPGLYAAADAHPWENEPVLHGASETGHGRHEIRTHPGHQPDPRRRSRSSCPAPPR